MAKKIESNVETAINELVSEGSKIEYGILNIVKNQNLGAMPAVEVPNAMVKGDELWVRKNSTQLGASRKLTLDENYYSDNDQEVIKIPMKEEWWIRFTIDVNALNSLGTTYTGQDLRDQLSSILFEGLKISNAAKFDAVAITTYQNGLDEETNPGGAEVAKVVYFDYDSMMTSTDVLDKVILSYQSINRSLSAVESDISAYNIGTNSSDFVAVTVPFIVNMISLYSSRFAGKAADGETNPNMQNLFGINWKKHPFFHKLANLKAADINNIDRNKTIFDIGTTYDFTDLLGLITHVQSALVPMKFVLLNAMPDPETGNLIVVSRIGYGASLIRKGLFIKIKNGSPDQNIYLQEVNRLATFLNNPANATVTASGTTLSTALLAKIKAYTPLGKSADFSSATVTSTSPTNAATVSAATQASAVISIPVKSGSEAKAQTAINISFFYKNS